LSAEISRTAIHVVAAAVLDPAGRVLIAQRPQGTHLAGGWEFPGGKLEPGEDRKAGLARELREELGIQIATPRPLIRLRHTYPERDVLLDVWVVRHYSGEPQGLDAQALRWCTQDELETVDLLPADGPVVRALRLPERLIQSSTDDYVMQDLDSPAGRAHAQLRGAFCHGIADAQEAERAGANFLALRDAVAPSDLRELCAQISVPVYARFQREVSLELTWALGATGTHELPL
jgi:mutator protein MutT